ncbi:Polysulfide reductase, NrfD [Thioalkalivibrio nitratireducens DSM 14787]|uniref:Polysulfide reductase, NrfD n=1 Tax=Thioalkalivibrio nitratireducens (strain DSM 14787 / UNIQEM 213 / ALEN2) TaxID=1255043 RepID=L0DUI2_THIND|nr:polysulfide reductase NrfD [Thioalkalivibrio nitratireducens]AGA32662.1 Polysulfide reductase, NrfD [Thioalkalivibrio nitratireducens DSM 14787]
MNSNVSVKDFLTPTWTLIAVGLVAGGAVGLYEMFFGHLFATNSALVWTLPLITYIFLALMSTGVSLVLAYGLIMDDEAITRHTRALLILAIGMLVGGFTALATELGSLLNMVWILLSPNPSSPIWWMGTLYSIELVLLFVKLVMDLKGRHGVFDLPLAWGTLLIAAAAAITIGAVFGTVIGRPDYHGAFLSVVTLVSALVSGTAAIVLLRPQSTLTETVGRIFRQTALLLAALLLIRVAYEAHSTVAGMLGWASISMLAPFIIAAALLHLAPRLLALLAIVAVLWVQYSFIITGQLVSLGPTADWYGAVQSYRPNLPEILILVLGIAVAAALIKLGEQFLMNDRNQATN